MRIAQEEIFGPVLVVIPFEDDEDAMQPPDIPVRPVCEKIDYCDKAERYGADVLSKLPGD